MPHTFTRPGKPIPDMTLEELSGLKRTWYSEARQSGALCRIEEVARELGDRMSVRHGPKHDLRLDEVYVYLDGYAGYLQAYVHRGGRPEQLGKLVCSTHPCTELFVPGEWFGKLEAYHPEAARKRQERERATEDGRRAKLIGELSG